MTLTVCGLILDVIGVWVLAYALISIRDDHIKKLAGAFWDENDEVIRSTAAQVLDAVVGVICLTLGFLLQLVGAFCPSLTVGYEGVLLTVIFGFLAISSYFLDIRGSLIEKRFAKINGL